MTINSIKYDGDRVVIKYENALGDYCSIEAPCQRPQLERVLSTLNKRVSHSLPEWQITVNAEKGTIAETVKRKGTLTLEVLGDLLSEATAFVEAKRIQLELFNAAPEGAKITDINVVREGTPA